MAQYPCENCKFRAHYDKNPKSVLGRFWRWHIGFCPGWKAYFTHQDDQSKAALREKYNLGGRQVRMFQPVGPRMNPAGQERRPER